ncbi:MAG: sigma-70 family RNA polymerase sigma factor [Clostridia bacterium]|nr:sigma-70 family RNA polymerase sigma factor [Clostridia bacterium]
MAEERFSDNAELLRLAAEGDTAALERLMENNLGLVRNIAVRFMGRGVEKEDLIQIGSVGMLKAIRSFDPSYNTAFSTYAVPLIIGEIRRYLRDDGIIHVGRKTRRLGAQILRVREEYIAKNGCEPGIDELADLCGVEREELIYALDAANPVASLSETLGEGGLTLETTIADNEDEIHALTERISLASALDSLPEQWRKIIYLRYFKNLTQQQCAGIMGLTQVKISREEKKILASLKEMLK